ncbi:MAG: hypothetical protein U1F68_14535 [Gammaproteobacteria bacterium]
MNANLKYGWLAGLLLCCASASAQPSISVQDSRSFTDPKLGVTIVRGEVELPSPGFWWPVKPLADKTLGDLYAVPPPALLQEMRGEPAKAGSSPIRWTLLGRLAARPTAPIAVQFRNPQTDATIAVTWDTRTAIQGDATLLREWATQRAAIWRALARQTEAPVLNHWLARLPALYNVQDSPPEPQAPWLDTERATSLFNALGGRAAVRETLQLQALRDVKDSGGASIPIATIQGVEVQSHPFAEMVRGVEAGHLALADVVPADRLFVYVAKPTALPPMLDQGAGFIADLGAAFDANSLDYDLKARMFARLGIAEDWVRALLEQKMVKELGVILPDLFLIDGADLTVVARMASPALAKAALTLLGLTGTAGADGLITRSGSDGGQSYWSVRDDLIVFGTQAGEVQRVLALAAAGGSGSLGQSAEFRYMLNRLPIAANTRLYAYFSDPFIRRLVGPEVKIGQLHRLRAHADLEALSAGVLLYRLDGHADQPSLARLAELGYVPADFSQRDYTLRADGSAASQRYGTLARPATLLDTPLTHASTAEAEAYRAYVEDYSRFWRQFFDPIAMRLDDVDADGSLELSTYILPLIDNTFYNGLRSVLERRESGIDLRIPELDPAPVLMFSMNLAKESLLQSGLGEVMREPFGAYSGFDPALIDTLGQALHVAIADADPIIALGSGDILGAVGGPTAFARGGMTLWLPVAMAVFTRPVKLMFELSDPAKALAILRRTPNQGLNQQRWGWRSGFYQISGRDAWVYEIAIEGMLALRFGVEVQQGYLTISNLPWSQRAAIHTVAPAPLNGAAIIANPGAGTAQLPGLFAAASAREREAAMSGIGYLYPMLGAGAQDVSAALRQHAALFGFQPVHPAGGDWEWRDDVLRSSVYGTLGRQTQPDYQPGKRDFGLLKAVDWLRVNMQFEDTGLRAALRWKPRLP